MLDKRYYEGFEGEGEVKVWSGDNGIESGMVIWKGFFETILEGGFRERFLKNGIIECYYRQDGFYDDKWEMQYPSIVLLISFINNAIKNKQKIYIEYI